MRALSVMCFLVFFSSQCQSARILGIFPLPNTKSHYILGSALMRALAEHGHDVTMISAFGEKNPPQGKYRDIVVHEVREYVAANLNKVDFFEIGNIPLVSVPAFAYLISGMGEEILKNQEVQSLIHSNEKFDAVIIEQFFNNDHKALANHFNAIQIIFTSLGANFWVSSLVGNPYPISYVPEHFSDYLPRMNFFERLSNTFFYLLHSAVHHWYLYPKHQAITQQYFPNSTDFYQTLYNASLVLLNSHSSLNQAVPHVPNMIEIAGFHIKPPAPLPSDLQHFLDNAKNGAIYFSLGSNLKSADLPIEKRRALLRTFAKLKENVLWKWEDDVLPDQPPNVKLGKWLPQQSILAHPNVKLFITHGGLLSKTETVYFGVPALIIPVYGDQRTNGLSIVNDGFGLMLSYKELTEESLLGKIQELLQNPKYAINAKTKSKLFHDRPLKPIDEALFWIDYVIRNKGAPHLKVVGADLPWYQYFLLDVIAFTVAVLFIGIFIIRLIFGLIYQKIYYKKVKVM